MKSSITFLILLAFIFGDACGQDLSTNAGIRAMSTANLTESLQAPKHYRYKEFRTGKIFYKNGKVQEGAKFNYDFVRGAMLVITERGDTLVMHDQGIFLTT